MRLLILASLASFASTFSITSISAGPLWSGPATPVQWHGFSLPTTSVVLVGDQPGLAATPDVSASPSDTPRWVGYYRRGGQWWVRIKSGEDEPVALLRGAATPDGWVVTGISTQAYRVDSVTVSRNGIDKTLTLETQ